MNIPLEEWRQFSRQLSGVDCNVILMPLQIPHGLMANA
jgi:hypothetical protein